MAVLPDSILTAWEDRNGPVILTTVDEAGVPNSIYATCTARYDAGTLVVADNYFDKTRRNIKNGGTGVLLFITNGGKAYQVKGKIEYHTQGPVFEHMKTWNPEQHPGHAAAALKVAEAYSGAEKLI